MRHIFAGIGRTTAVALHAAGWSVALTGRRTEALEETVKLCDGGSEDRCLVVPGNITNEEFVEKLFESTVSHFGQSSAWSFLYPKILLPLILIMFVCIRQIGPSLQCDFLYQSVHRRQSTHVILDHPLQNAGISQPQMPLEDLPLSVFHDVLETNVVAPFLCTRYAFKIFKRQSPQGGWY